MESPLTATTAPENPVIDEFGKLKESIGRVEAEGFTPVLGELLEWVESTKGYPGNLDAQKLFRSLEDPDAFRPNDLQEEARIGRNVLPTIWLLMHMTEQAAQKVPQFARFEELHRRFEAQREAFNQVHPTTPLDELTVNQFIADVSDVLCKKRGVDPQADFKQLSESDRMRLYDTRPLAALTPQQLQQYRIDHPGTARADYPDMRPDTPSGADIADERMRHSYDHVTAAEIARESVLEEYPVVTAYALLTPLRKRDALWPIELRTDADRQRLSSEPIS